MQELLVIENLSLLESHRLESLSLFRHGTTVGCVQVEFGQHTESGITFAKRQSEFIGFPIELYVVKSKEPKYD